MFLFAVLSLITLAEYTELRVYQEKIACPCGRTGRNFTLFCDSDNLAKTELCERFRLCQTCSDGVSRCMSCPEGRSGPYCTQVGSVETKKIASTSSVEKRYVRGIQCPDLPGPKLGSIRCWQSRREKECVGKCLPGHFFPQREVEEIVLRCRDGWWIPLASFPPCVSQGLCDLEMNGPGSYNCTIGSFGTACDVRCTGYPTINRRFSCYPGRNWEPQLPYCVKTKVSGHVEPDCDCQNGGSCDPSTGNCICPPNYSGSYCEVYSPPVNYCSDPGEIENGQRVDSEGRETSRNALYEERSTVVYSCKAGFALVGSSLLTCRASGSWSAKPPTCQRIRTTTTTTTTIKPQVRARSCPDPGFISNGERWNSDGTPANRRKQSFQEGSSIVFSCKDGYALHGLSLITCLPSERWSRPLPSCKSVAPLPPSTTTEPPDTLAYCEDPGVDPNGDRTEVAWLDARRLGAGGGDADEEMFPQGMRMEYTCKEGFSLQGQATITCLYTGRWSHPRPSCQSVRRTGPSALKYCEDPGYVSNSRRSVIYNINERRKPDPYDDTDLKVQGVKIEYICEDDLEIVGAGTITCLPNGTWSAPPPECRAGCGFNFISTTRRIIRGRKTSAGDWPWQVAIGNKKRGDRVDIICGGALVNPRTVITAAHCVDGRRIHRIVLYFGKYYVDPKKDDQNVISRQPSAFVVHPRYEPDTFNYDIAIIRFAPDVKTSNRIQPICLPTPETTRQNLVRGKKGFVVGWGLTEDNVQPDSLLVAQVPVVPTQECTKAYREQQLEFPITDNMLCAGYEEGRVDSCTGDSGGPLMFQDAKTKRFILEGLVSFGVQGGCAVPRRYTVYTKVGNLLKWIKANL